MMTNLFSIFDPSTSLLKISWLTLPLTVLVFNPPFWKVNNNSTKITKAITKTIYKEVSITSKKSKTIQPMVITLFTVILLLNFIALYPNVFSPTSHLVVTFPLSLVFWISTMLFGWISNTKSLLIHLVPQGTPVSLMAFMVLIELTSNLTRPITLCVRLTANLIAGHLLMSLLGNAILSMTTIPIAVLLVVPLALTILESAVACIQSYVLMTLVTLYITEVK